MTKPTTTIEPAIEPALTVSQWAALIGRDRTNVGRWFKRAGITPPRKPTLRQFLKALGWKRLGWCGHCELSALDSLCREWRRNGE